MPHRRLLSGAVARDADRQHAWRDAGVRAQHRPLARRGRRRGRGLHLHRRPQWRRGRRDPGARVAGARDWRGPGPDRAAVAEAVVGAALWRPRRADGAGDLGPRHGLWDLKAKRAGRPCGGCSAATIRMCPATPAGSTCSCRSTSSCGADRPEPRARLPGDQDEGRPADAGRGCRARRGDAPASGRRLPAHAGCQHALDGGSGLARGAGVRGLRSGLARGAGGPRGPARPRARRRGGRCRRGVGREPAQPLGLSRPDHAGQGGLPGARRHQLRRRDLIHEDRPPRRGLQPAGHVARRPRRHRPAAGRWPNRSWLEAHGFGLERYVEEPLAIADGCAIAPDRPGHGIAFDWHGLEALRA